MRIVASIALAITVAMAPVASGQTLAPVESMTCAQMSAEMMTAGQLMKSQFDPNYVSDMQRGANDIRQQRDAAAAAAPGMTASSLACSAGVVAACVANSAKGRELDATAAANAPRNQAYAERGLSGALNATRGLDMARMQALGTRFEAQRCQMPGG